MIDGYFLKSLCTTLAAYLCVFAALAAFVAVTGLAGVSLIALVVVLLLTYFYGGFSPRGRGSRS